MVVGKLDTHKKINLEPFQTPHTKIKSKCIKMYEAETEKRKICNYSWNTHLQ